MGPDCPPSTEGARPSTYPSPRPPPPPEVDDGKLMVVPVSVCRSEPLLAQAPHEESWTQGPTLPSLWLQVSSTYLYWYMYISLSICISLSFWLFPYICLSFSCCHFTWWIININFSFSVSVPLLLHVSFSCCKALYIYIIYISVSLCLCRSLYFSLFLSFSTSVCLSATSTQRSALSPHSLSFSLERVSLGVACVARLILNLSEIIFKNPWN